MFYKYITIKRITYLNMKKIPRNITKIIEVLKKGSVSIDDYYSSQNLFIQNKYKNIEFNYDNLDSNLQSIPLQLNYNVILIYKIVNNYNKEIYLGEWTIFSLKEAIKQYEDYCSKGQTNIFNVAYRDIGMGHVQVISCDLKTHLLFYRYDGGSNGWDRDINYNKIINKGSKDYKQILFTEWFYSIKFNELE